MPEAFSQPQTELGQMYAAAAVGADRGRDAERKLAFISDYLQRAGVPECDPVAGVVYLVTTLKLERQTAQEKANDAAKINFSHLRP